MPRVDFYLLNDSQPTARLNLACRLVDKAYQRDHKIYLHLPSEAEASTLDKLLWTFREDGFIPHAIYGDTALTQTPIQLGVDIDPTNHSDLLFNLTQQIPPFFSRFQRVIEIIHNDPTWREQARTRYRQYKEQGCELTTHQI